MKGVSLKEVVRAFCTRLGLPFDKIVEVHLNHPTEPTEVRVFFSDRKEAVVLEIKRPLAS